MENNIKRTHSKILNLPIKYDGKILTVKELKKFGTRGYVTYTREEMRIIKETVGEITRLIHNCKSVFDGVIVREEG